MAFMRSKNPTFVVRLLVFASCLSAILVLASGVYAQTTQLKATPSPATITDAAKPGDVVLHVTKADGTAVDQATFNQFGSLKVGEVTVAIKSPDVAAGNVTFSAPPSLTGTQKVQLLDKTTGQALSETQLQYPNQTGGTGNAPTQNPQAVDNRQTKLSEAFWYSLAILVLYGFMLVTFVVLIYRVIRFSKSSFRNLGGFPIGSFRTILAFVLVALLGFYVLASILSLTEFKPPESLLGIVATVVGFYFGSRSDEAGGDGVANVVRGMVTAGFNPARGAIVKFRRDDGTEPYIRVTDIEGRFTPVNAKPGKYTVQAELTGLQPAHVTLTVAEGSDQEIVIALHQVITSP
jgi:heme/copper-type cytochrome/quinol oxidase subunit 2